MAPSTQAHLCALFRTEAERTLAPAVFAQLCEEGVLSPVVFSEGTGAAEIVAGGAFAALLPMSRQPVRAFTVARSREVTRQLAEAAAQAEQSVRRAREDSEEQARRRARRKEEAHAHGARRAAALRARFPALAAAAHETLLAAVRALLAPTREEMVRDGLVSQEELARRVGVGASVFNTWLRSESMQSTSLAASTLHSLDGAAHLWLQRRAEEQGGTPPPLETQTHAQLVAACAAHLMPVPGHEARGGANAAAGGGVSRAKMQEALGFGHNGLNRWLYAADPTGRPACGALPEEYNLPEKDEVVRGWLMERAAEGGVGGPLGIEAARHSGTAGDAAGGAASGVASGAACSAAGGAVGDDRPPMAAPPPSTLAPGGGGLPPAGGPPAGWAWPKENSWVEVEVLQEGAAEAEWVPAQVKAMHLDGRFLAAIGGDDPFDDWFSWQEEGKDWRRRRYSTSGAKSAVVVLPFSAAALRAVSGSTPLAAQLLEELARPLSACSLGPTKTRNLLAAIAACDQPHAEAEGRAPRATMHQLAAAAGGGWALRGPRHTSTWASGGQLVEAWRSAATGTMVAAHGLVQLAKAAAALLASNAAAATSSGGAEPTVQWKEQWVLPTTGEPTPKFAWGGISVSGSAGKKRPAAEPLPLPLPPRPPRPPTLETGWVQRAM